MLDRLFRHENRAKSEEARALHARFELVRTAVDFPAALAFLAGSCLFFFPSSQYAATWLFVVGSLAFAARPSLKMLREIRLYRLGDMHDLARRAGQ